MLSASVAGALPAVADSARVVEHVYAVSLSALAPLAIAAVAMVSLRRSRAASRAAVLKAATVALLVVYLGALVPVHRVAWVVPAGLAAPLIALGRMQMGEPLSNLLGADGGHTETWAVQLVFALYVAGTLAVLIPLGAATVRLALRSRRSTPLDDARIARLFDDARRAAGVRRPVRLLSSPDVPVPMTWGLLTPSILLPAECATQHDDRLRVILLHELTHVRSGDAAFMVLSRLCCAAFWFNPAVWVIDRRLRADCEEACDDRVLGLGVLQSEYAELLVAACDRLHGRETPRLAMAICERTGIRERLRAIVDPARERRRASRATSAFAVSVLLVTAAPASVVQLAPTRSVLTSLMHDHRWESRAYAVLGLAQRPDSIEVARSAAATDPDPKVRAWARYAVSLEPVAAGIVRPSPLR